MSQSLECSSTSRFYHSWVLSSLAHQFEDSLTFDCFSFVHSLWIWNLILLMHLLWIKFKKVQPLFNNLLDHWVDSAHLVALLTKCFTVLIFLTLTLRNLKTSLQVKIKAFYSLPLLLQVKVQVLVFRLKVSILLSLLKLILSKLLSFANLSISILNSQVLKNFQKKWLFEIDRLFNTEELCVFKNQVIDKLLLVSSFSHTLDSQ